MWLEANVFKETILSRVPGKTPVELVVVVCNAMLHMVVGINRRAVVPAEGGGT